MAARLKGRNRIGYFKKVAAEFASKIKVLDGVAGILFIGGLVRGFADEFSDLGIVVFIKGKNEGLKKRLIELWLDAEHRHNVEIDLEIHSIEDFMRQALDEAERWEFSKAEIVFDPDGEARKALTAKLRVSKRFWTKRIVIFAECLKWYCCPTKKDAGTIAEVWIKRGDLTSAHYCLNYAVELIIKLVFALNKEFLPSPKWRIFRSYSLKWLPKNYKRLIKEALKTDDLSLENFKKRLDALQKLGREIYRKIEEATGLDAELVSKYYVEKVLHQTWVSYRH